MSKVTKEMWIMAGFEVLAQEGPRLLTILRLCEKLKVTKGAFYHCFRDKEELECALLETWSDHSTNSLIFLASKGVSPYEKLHTLILEGFLELHGKWLFHEVEIALEAWALSGPKVSEFVMKIRCTRFDFLLEIFKEIVTDEKKAKIEAMKVYCLALGIPHLPIRPSKTDLLKVFSEYLP